MSPDLPPIPIAAPYIGQAEQEAVARVLTSGQIASGPEVRKFETEFAEAMGAKHAVAITNGTVAIEVTLAALGIGPGHKVIVPAFTFIATANAVLARGATPVLADVRPDTFNLDPEAVRKAIDADTRAVLAVHLYGQGAEMDTLQDICGDADIALIGDAAQAHGATWNDQPVNRFAAASTWSLYPTKNMTSGEGGMVTTDDDELAAVVSSIVNQGRGTNELGGYDHVRWGTNGRMSDVHAAIGRVQLTRLGEVTQARRATAAAYDEVFGAADAIQAPYVEPKAGHVYHQYTVRCRDRDTLMGRLKAAGVGHGIYYPKPLHHYAHLTEVPRGGSLAEAEAAAGDVLSLPVHPGVDAAARQRVIAAVLG